LSAALWTSGGIFLGAASYRSGVLGSVAIVGAIPIAGVAGLAIGSDWGLMAWLFEQFTGQTDIHPAVGIPVYVGCIALIRGLTWAIIRDMPVRNKAT
jgi:hypothetical protein